MQHGTTTTIGKRILKPGLLGWMIATVAASSPAATESWRREMVETFKVMCVDPQTPAAMLEAGEKLAAERQWQLNQEKSGRQPFIYMHMPPDPNGKPFFVARLWEFSVPPAIEVYASVLITGPENPDVRYTICGFGLRGRVDEEIAREIPQVFGSAVIPHARQPQVRIRHWLLARDGAAVGDCRRAFSVDADASVTMFMLIEHFFPDSWGPISKASLC